MYGDGDRGERGRPALRRLSALERALRTSAQAYYDELIEPLFPPTSSSYRAYLEAATPFAPLAFAAGDVAVTSGLLAYFLKSSAAAAAAVAAAALVAARRAAKPTRA